MLCPALQQREDIMTLEQYEHLPEDLRVEIFEGLAYDMASPSQLHQTILTEILVLLRNYIRKKGGNCQVFPAPFDVKLNDAPLTIVQPDIMVICDNNKLDGKRCNGAPDFVIEIVSPNIRQMIISGNYIITKNMVCGNIGLLTRTGKQLLCIGLSMICSA